VGGGVKHHLDHTVNVPVHRGQRADVDAEPARDGRAHGRGVELLAFDLAGLDDIFGQGRQTGLVSQGHADVGRAPHQQPLGAADVGQGWARAAKSKR
jgi:hypothetical protein